MKSRAFALLGALAVGCGPSVDLPGDSNDDTSGSSSESTDPTRTTVAPSTASTTGTTTVGPTTEPPSASAVTTANPSASATVGPGGECNISEDDDECMVCTKLECCFEYLECFETSPECGCLVDCVNDSELPLDESLPQCQAECELQTLPVEAIGLQACAVQNCPECAV